MQRTRKAPVSRAIISTEIPAAEILSPAARRAQRAAAAPLRNAPSTRGPEHHSPQAPNPDAGSKRQRCWSGSSGSAYRLAPFLTGSSAFSMFSFDRPLYCLRRQRNPGDSWPIVGRRLRSSEDSTIPVELSTQLAGSEKTHFGASGHIRSAFAGPSTTDERTRCRGGEVAWQSMLDFQLRT